MKRNIIAKLLSVSVILSASICFCANAASSSQNWYNSVEETENQEVIELTEEIAEKYPICPEVLQAIIFYESSNRRTVVSCWGDIGYMQVNPKWQHERMDRLGVSDLTDGYGNVLVGTDYLYELCKEYEDMAVALTAYNKGKDYIDKSMDENGMVPESCISEYAIKILDLSSKLERLHGK